MGTIDNLGHPDTGNVPDSMATDLGIVQRRVVRQRPMMWAYASLLLFMVVYFARPEDWIFPLARVPLAKIAGFLALLAFVLSLGQIRQRLPREIIYLVLLTTQLFLAASLSPVWRGGAFYRTLDFAKVLLIVIVMDLSVRTEKRLRQLMFVQAASVALIAAIAVWKGRLLVGRLEGVLNGNYSNPNDLALAIVISLPLCLALLFHSTNKIWKALWVMAMLAMTYAIVLTASRAGLIGLLITVTVCLWEFAIKGRRRYLLVIVSVVGAILWLSSSGRMLRERLNGTFNPNKNVASAYGSAQQREDIFWRSIEVTREHPLVGVGAGNFQVISGSWHVTHNSYTEMSSEGGIPALILYLLILWYGFENVAATKRSARRQRDSALLAGALHASLAGFVVGALFASEGYQYFPYFLTAYTTALVRIAKKRASHSRERKSVAHLILEDQAHANSTAPEISWHSC